MPMEDDPKIIYSDLCREITEGGVTIKVLIYRLEKETDWALEVVDQLGGSTTWDQPFPTERDALDEVFATVAKEGIGSFIAEPRTTLH
jgi:hypothetical protein